MFFLNFGGVGKLPGCPLCVSGTTDPEQPQAWHFPDGDFGCLSRRDVFQPARFSDNLAHLSPPFSFRFSAFAIRDPNCIARFGSTHAPRSPSVYAAPRSKIFSPTPRGKRKSDFSETSTSSRKATTASSKYGNRASLPWSDATLREKSK